MLILIEGLFSVGIRGFGGCLAYGFWLLAPGGFYGFRFLAFGGFWRLLVFSGFGF